MTYPPQQPPGQPGPYGQDPYGQQQQPGQYGQQPGQYGQYGQQPGQYGQQPGQQPGQYGPPGYPGGPPPQKKKTGMIVAIVVIAVVVLAGAGVGIYFLTKDDDKDNNSSGDPGQSETNKPDPNTDEGKPTDSEPTGGNGGGNGGSEEDLLAVAKDYADAVNSADEAGATELTCDQTGPGSLYTVTNSGGQTPGDVEVDNPTVLGNNNGTVEVTLSGSSQDPIPLLFEFKDDKWCVTV